MLWILGICFVLGVVLIIKWMVQYDDSKADYVQDLDRFNDDYLP